MFGLPWLDRRLFELSVLCLARVLPSFSTAVAVLYFSEKSLLKRKVSTIQLSATDLAVKLSVGVM